MIWTLIALAIAGIVFPAVDYKNKKKESEKDSPCYPYDFEDYATDCTGRMVLLVISCIVFVFLFLGAIATISEYIKGNLLGQKIEMLQSQNADIEGKIEVVVKEYMSYENQTYLDLKPSQMVIFAASYPALQSNNLVQEQIKTYQENNNKIIDLKNQQIDNSLNKWWLYFGN